MVAGLAALRPSDKGGDYSDYFRSLNSTLRKAGIDKPSLIIDLDRLDRNIDRLVASISEGSHKDYRVVTKSIPSAPLVDYVSKRAGTQSQMVFHRPFLQAMATQQPKSTLLLLVSALAGADTIRAAYAAAVAERYRFYSYGDAMFIRPAGV